MDDFEDIQFRFAALSDIDELISFWSINSENANRPIDTRELVMQLIEKDSEALTVAIKESRIIGTVIAGWDGWRGSIYRLTVENSARRSGLGTQLMTLAEQRLMRLGAQWVSAMVLDSNHEAHPFYSSLNYTKQVEWHRWIKDLPI